jgi:hypothetical protein
MDENQTGDEVTLEPQEEVEVEEVAEESTDDVAARLAKAEELAKNYKIRAEKAEAKAKEVGESKPASQDLSAMDILAVSRAGIEPEDLEDVLDYAKYKGIPVHEALKSSVVKATLAEKQEVRKSAQATNTGGARRGTSAIPDDRLISEASRGGVLPDSDADMERLVKLRFQKRG